MIAFQCFTSVRRPHLQGVVDRVTIRLELTTLTAALGWAGVRCIADRDTGTPGGGLAERSRTVPEPPRLEDAAESDVSRALLLLLSLRLVFESSATPTAKETRVVRAVPAAEPVPGDIEPSGDPAAPVPVAVP